ncbi:hypothetical protein EGM51_02185 [Verrucomicrobia bacterium S94]|nr:hypothetical protein EGM51_02185 [Verrucomicrobia bacterium S94]
MPEASSSGSADSPFRTAVLPALCADTSLAPITEHIPAYLLPLSGKNMADRIAGRLSDLGIEDLVIIINDKPDAAAAFFGNGTRWGLKIRLIDISRNASVVERLKRLDIRGAYLLGDLFRLPPFDAEHLHRMHANGSALLMDENGVWTGWASLTPSRLNHCTAASPDELADFLLRENVPSLPVYGPELNCRSSHHLLSSSKILLHHQFPGQFVYGPEKEKGLWIGAGSVIHPSVRLQPPVWIGENCRIEKNSVIGPDVSIAERCIIRKQTTLKACCVMKDTCIESQLELEKAVIDRNHLAYKDPETSAVSDRFPIAANHQQGRGRLTVGIAGRIAALLILLLTWPLTLLIALVRLMKYRQLPIRRIQCVKIPTETDPALWKTFSFHQWTTRADPKSRNAQILPLLRLLPALPDIAFGQLHWVGLAPRNAEEILALNEDWRRLYLRGKPGLFQLAEVDRYHIGDSSADQQFSSESFYTAAQSFRTDCNVLRRYLAGQHEPTFGKQSPHILTMINGEETIDEFHAFINEQLRSTSQDNISRQRKNDIITALHEALINIIKHAYEAEKHQPIQIHVNSQPASIAFSLYDKGKPFDIDAIHAPDFSGQSTSGFGWHIINQIADRIEYSRYNGWNRLLLTFNRSEKGDTE